MRTRVTKTAWFGPKKYVGWGWRITSWQGWAATAVFFALLILTAATLHQDAPIPILVLVIAYGVVVLLTGDPPGSPRSRRDNH